MSLTGILKQAIQLIKQEPLIVAPYVMYAWAIISIESVFPLFKEGMAISDFLIRYATSNWLVELVVIAVTITMATTLQKKRKIKGSKVLSRVMNRYTQLVIATSITVIPTGVASFYMMQSLQANTEMPTISLIILSIMLPLGVLLAFVPVALLSDDISWRQSIVVSARFVYKEFRVVLVYLLLVVTINMLMHTMSLLFMNIPLLGRSLFFGFFQGIGNSIIYIINVVVFISVKSKPTITHTA